MPKKPAADEPAHQPEGGPIEVRGDEFMGMVRQMLAAKAMPLPPRKKKSKPDK